MSGGIEFSPFSVLRVLDKLLSNRSEVPKYLSEVPVQIPKLPNQLPQSDLFL